MGWALPAVSRSNLATLKPLDQYTLNRRTRPWFGKPVALHESRNIDGTREVAADGRRAKVAEARAP
jgi:hypothetical protein